MSEMTYSLPLRGRAGVGASGAHTCPHLNPPQEGEGERQTP
jgi:hypothetical protein